MDQLVSGIRQCIASRSWYGALALALTAPSVCGVVEFGRDNMERYIAWFDANLAHHYTRLRPGPVSAEQLAWQTEYLRRNATPEARGADYVQFITSRPNFQPPEMLPHRYVTGEDLYHLRCALLHQGMADLTDRANPLDSFVFIEPRGQSIMHCNQMDGPGGGLALQLQVDIFASQVADAVEAWFVRLVQTPEIAARLARHLHIHRADGAIQL